MEPLNRAVGVKIKNKDSSKQLLQTELNFVSTMLMTKKMENLVKEIALDLNVFFIDYIIIVIIMIKKLYFET